MPGNHAFDRAVEDIADGKPVDWDLLDSQASDADEREQLKWLRILQDVNALHRSSGDELNTATTDEGLGARASEPPVVTDFAGRAWGRVQLLQRVGEGSFGSVYRGWDPQLEREIAVKILHGQFADDQLAERLLREGRALARVRHTNVVAVHAVEAHEGRVGLCMEFVRGHTLDDLLRTQGTFTTRATLATGESLCRALMAVHHAGFVHRDVKARNVMHEDGGRVVLMDFGAGQEARTLEALRGRGITGTPLYMAPEVLAGETATPASDLYSVGVLLFHLLTGDYPVNGRNLDELREAHRQGTRTFLTERRPDVPRPLARVIDRTLSPSAVGRYGNAGALLEALETISAREYANRSFLKRLATIGLTLLTLVAIAMALGGMETLAFNSTMDRLDFAQENPADWLRWGLKSSLGPFVLMLLACLTISIGLFIRTLVLRMSRRAASLDATAERKVREWARRWSLGDASLLASWLLLGSGAALLAAWWYFFPLFDAYTTKITQGSSDTLALLSPAFADTHDNYRLTFTWLALVLGVLWYIVVLFARRTRQTLGTGLKAGALVLILLSFMSMDLPYRILLHNRFELATWQDHDCYVLGERPDDRLLFCPDLPTSRRRMAVPKQDGTVQLTGRSESVYTRFTPAPKPGA